MARIRQWNAIAIGACLLAATVAPPSASVPAARAAVCSSELEPNDTEGQAGSLSGSVCLNGSLPDGDQDLFVWDTGGSSAARWTFSLTGVDGTVTAIKVLSITSAPGVTPVVAGPQIYQLASPAVGFVPVQATDLLLAPGRYLLGLTRTATPTGSAPLDTSYSFSIKAGTPLPANRDHEPNDDIAHAVAVNGTLSLTGDSGGSEDFYDWSPSNAAPRWQLDLQIPIGTSATMVVRDRAGAELARAFNDGEGHARLHDLVIRSRDVILELPATTPQAYVLTATPETFPNGDPEPNNSAAMAVPLVATNLAAAGRLSQVGDKDDYALHVDDHLASVLLDIKLIWQAGPGRQLCLFDSTGAQLLCRTQDHGDVLGNLFLPVGDYTIEVRGDPSPGDPYLLRVDPTSAPAADFETEPNDQPTDASPWTAGVVMRGRATLGDIDVYRVTVSGAPQLWQLDAAGSEIDSLTWLTKDGTVLEPALVASGGRSASLEDMYLVPGDHWIQVDAFGDYTLTLTPLGPPDPNGELEPNNDSLHAQALALGTPRTGRLVRPTDLDINRFSLQAAERLHLHIAPPADGSIGWRIYSGNTEVDSGSAGASGAVVDSDLALPAGDYELWLSAGQTSTGRYSVQLDREDPFTPAAALSATLNLTLAAPAVAAYWDAGQHVTGQLMVTNTAAASEDLQLDALTSDGRWSVSLGQTAVSVAAGASATVPVTLDVPADAWADVPVRTTLRVRDASGAQQTAFAELTPGRDVAPVDPYQAWSVPSALLGGLDVASTALGGAPVPSHDPDMEAQLYDGYSPAGAGFGSAVTLPVTFVSDLAGDAPVQVAGMMLNPQARNADLSEAPKDVELLLSDDGTTWTSVLSATMTPLSGDQAFVLPTPVAARFAQLKIDSTYGDGTRVALGEFKVIATPGTAPTAAPINVADPAVGGHIVLIEPQNGFQQTPDTMLSADLNATGVFARAGVRPTWILGFWNDRTAQLGSLEWVDPTASDPTRRYNAVDIATSLGSPLGPWTQQGTWKLKRNADGTVAPFAFPTPLWARYVRFTADAAKTGLLRELPATLRALEVPTDATNRSVLGEFGPTQPGPYELAHPPQLAAPTYAVDPNDTPDTATPLAADTAVTSTAHTGQDVDWYDVTAPAGQNTLTFSVAGAPRVGVSLSLVDDAGGSVPMTFGRGTDPGSVTYTASVVPGQHYHVEVQQPPFSAIFSFDTSGSMGNYLPFVYEGIQSFSNDVVPGREAVKIIPFEQSSLLQDWSDDRYALQDAVEGVVAGNGSSAAETSLLDATDQLASREGATAVVIVTDADSTSYDQSTALWTRLAAIRPLVFSVHVAAEGVIAQATHLMQDWADSSNGFYQYTRSHGEMDRAFDRMATWLERPTQYTLAYSATFVKPPSGGSAPGTLRVVGANQGDPSKVPVASNVAIELILDTSGSMLDRLEGRRRIDVAESVLTHLVRDKLPPGVPLAFRVFGDTPNSCDTRLAVPLGPLQPDQLIAQIDGIHTLTSVNTPIGTALKQVASDLKTVTGPRIVVLMTDGEENCGGNPAAAVKALAKAGVDVHVNIVGFQIGQKSLRAQMAAWAKIGHGTFFNAFSSGDLNTALALAVSAPYRVLDANGKVVASGTVNGAPISLKPGTYHVVVLTQPEIHFDAVVVESGKPLELTLPTNPT